MRRPAGGKRHLTAAAERDISIHTKSMYLEGSYGPQQAPGGDGGEDLDGLRKAVHGEGYEHTTLQDIIDDLGGLTKGAIYHHFKGKEEILLAIADRMGEQTEAWMQAIRDDPGLTGAEKLRRMFRASLGNSDQTDLFVLAPNMLKNPKLMAILLESMMEDVLPNYMEPVLREAVADDSIRTDYPEELGELLLLLSNVWLNPMIYPATPEKTRRRMELYVQLLRSMGLDLLDQELLDQWEQFCRLSQERL